MPGANGREHKGHTPTGADFLVAYLFNGGAILSLGRRFWGRAADRSLDWAPVSISFDLANSSRRLLAGRHHHAQHVT